MEIAELRIGNWVKAPVWRSEGLHEQQVENIKLGWVSKHRISGGKEDYNKGSKMELCINHGFKETGYEYGPHIKTEVEGIPLTPDWALRFQFKYDGRSYDRDGIALYFDKDGIRVYFCTHLQRQIKLKYVHELQNLFYWYTWGTDLQLMNE